MKWLVLVHVLSAIIGVGPSFFGHILFRNKQTLEELRMSVKLFKLLEVFPKIGGTLAVITGILLISLNDYGKFTALWLIGSLILYIIIQVIVIGFAAPLGKKLAGQLFDPAQAEQKEVSTESRAILKQLNSYFYAVSALAIVLFAFMILKPGL